MINPVTSGKLFGRPIAGVPLSAQEQELIGVLDKARVSVVKLESELKQLFERRPRLSENSFDANDIKDRLRGAREYFEETKRKLSDLRSSGSTSSTSKAILNPATTERYDFLITNRSSKANNPLSTSELQRSLQQYDASGKMSVLGRGQAYLKGQYVDKVL